MKVVNPEDDDWDDLFENFSFEDLQEINNKNLKLGYDENDTEDKMDFLNRLPFDCKTQWIEEIEQKQMKKMSMEDKERVTNFLNKWKQSDTRFAGSQEESLLYPTPEPTEKKNEKKPKVTEIEAELRHLTMDSEEDEQFVAFITSLIPIPKPTGKY